MNPEEEDSELVFGAWDETRFSGSMSWYKVENRRFFSIELDDVKINGESLGFCNDKKCLITPDSGTSLNTFPSWAYKKFMDNYG